MRTKPMALALAALLVVGAAGCAEPTTVEDGGSGQDAVEDSGAGAGEGDSAGGTTDDGY